MLHQSILDKDMDKFKVVIAFQSGHSLVYMFSARSLKNVLEGGGSLKSLEWVDHMVPPDLHPYDLRDHPLPPPIGCAVLSIA